MVLSLQEIVFIHYSLFFSVLSVEDWICFFKDWILIRKKKILVSQEWYWHLYLSCGVFVISNESIIWKNLKRK